MTEIRARTNLIAHHFRQAELHALAEVERLVRQIMRTRKSCVEFCMAMGTYSFYDTRGELISDRRFLDHFDKFMGEWDSYLHLTGTPMKIVGADGPLLKDW